MGHSVWEGGREGGVGKEHHFTAICGILALIYILYIYYMYSITSIGATHNKLSYKSKIKTLSSTLLTLVHSAYTLAYCSVLGL